jgi:rhodanese-related sulfurtransferase
VTRFQELSPTAFETALAASPRPYVLDVRDEKEFLAGHVPSSRSIHVHELAARRDELPTAKITRILLVGDTEKRVQAAATWLALVGFADVGVLVGGFAAWKGPVETGPPPPPKPRGPELRVI